MNFNDEDLPIPLLSVPSKYSPLHKIYYNHESLTVFKISPPSFLTLTMVIEILGGPGDNNKTMIIVVSLTSH